jgi:hypothetical protein
MPGRRGTLRHHPGAIVLSRLERILTTTLTSLTPGERHSIDTWELHRETRMAGGWSGGRGHLLFSQAAIRADAGTARHIL